jgi:predicted TIM-barrel fold metal-dependent hydrolase
MLDQPRPTRRALLLNTAVAAAASAFASSTYSAETPPPGIVDTHQHLWERGNVDVAWTHADPLFDRDYAMADYRAAVEGLNVERVVYMEVAVNAQLRTKETEYILGVIEHHEGPTVAAVIGGDPYGDSFRAYVDRFKNHRQIKGVRCLLAGDASSRPAFLDNVRYLGEIGWRFDLLPDPTKLADAAKVAAACPNTRFILDHCGNASTAFYADEKQKDRRRAWEEGLAALAEQKNVICKISGVCEAGPRELATIEHATPVVDRCLDRFGPDRAVFAGNWPVCLKSIALKGWVEMLRQITAARGEAFQRKLFHDNAMSFYELT